MSSIVSRGHRVRRWARDPQAADLRWGIAGLCAAVLLLIAIGAVYVTGTSPERTYAAELAQAGSVRPGDDVRLAGIPVGKVRSLTLLTDRFHPARGAPELPPMSRSGRAFAQATFRHLLFGVVLGVLVSV